jgi:hypothetical protein
MRRAFTAGTAFEMRRAPAAIPFPPAWQTQKSALN